MVFEQWQTKIEDRQHYNEIDMYLDLRSVISGPRLTGSSHSLVFVFIASSKQIQGNNFSVDIYISILSKCLVELSAILY